MRDYVSFLILGLGTGAVYAMLGLGLVLTHRASGVINFAHGAIAMFPTFVFAELQSTGDLVFPVGRLGLGGPLGLWPAALIAIVYAGALGLVSYALIFRPLRFAPPLSRVVASVGLAVTLQALAIIRFGPNPRTIEPILPSSTVSVLGFTIPADRFWLTGVALVAAVGLWAVYRFTRFGLATRAAAENEKGAIVLGFSPTRLAVVNWVLASVLAGIAGILIAPITNLNASIYTLLVVPALGAAMVGRFNKFGVTVLAGLGIGMLQSEVLLFQTKWGWFPDVGAREALPFAVIVIAMIVGGERLPARGSFAAAKLPAAGPPKHLGRHAVVTLALGTLALVVLQGGYRAALITSLLAAIICLSLVVLTGYVGQISLAQMTFAGASGFLVSKLTVLAGIGFPLAPVLGGLFAAIVGTLVGLPALRVRGVNLAVVTLALGVAIDEMVFKNPALTGGFTGSSVEKPYLLGWDLSIRGTGTGDYPTVIFGMVVLLMLIGLATVVACLRRSATGRRMLAVRANERAAAASGVNVASTKLVAFAISAFMAGIGGAMIGYQQGRLSFETFTALASLTFLTVAYLGGINRISGAVIGGLLVSNGLIFTALDNWISFGTYVTLASGLGVVITAVMNPEGIAGALPQMLSSLRGRLRPPLPGTKEESHGALA